MAKQAVKTSPATVGSRVVEHVEIGKITSSLFERAESGEISEMAQNVKKHGIQQPILVRKLKNGYQVIAGFRRVQAAKIAGLTTIPAIVVQCDEISAIERSLSSDLFTKQLTDYEIALRIKAYMEKANVKASTVAKKLGKSPSWVSEKLKLLKLDSEIQEAVKNSKITAKHALQISKIKDEKKRKEILKKAKEDKLTVQEASKEAEKEKEKEQLREQLEELRKKLNESPFSF